ncbi:hypothetical protein [Klebsiella pneumoniae]
MAALVALALARQEQGELSGTGKSLFTGRWQYSVVEDFRAMWHRISGGY